MGNGCIDLFLTDLVRSWKELLPKTQYKINWTNDSRNQHSLIHKCTKCNIQFCSVERKHTHHDHLKQFDNYITALCFKCNVQTRVQTKLLMFAHHANYDFQFILRYSEQNWNIKLLPQKSSLNYYRLVLNGNISFMDSYQFLKSSLSNLGFQYNDDCKSIPVSEQHCFLREGLQTEINIQLDSELYNLLKAQRGNLTFSYIDCESKLLDSIFPGIIIFFNDLRDQTISDKNYGNSKKYISTCQLY